MKQLIIGLVIFGYGIVFIALILQSIELILVSNGFLAAMIGLLLTQE